MRAQLVVDVGGALTFDPPEGGRASAQTVALHKPDSTVVQAAVAATLDSVNTTLSANAAIGDYAVTLTDSAGVAVGRTYRIDNLIGQHERIVVTSVNSSTDEVGLRDALQYTCASTSTFFGERFSFAVSAANADTRDRGYEARWLYTIGGVDYAAITSYDVVRQKWPDVLLSTDRFKRFVASDLAADIMQLVERKGEDFAEEIAVATERMRGDIRRRDVEIDLFRSHAEFEAVAAEAVLLMWAERGFTPQSWEGDAEGWYEHQLGLYERKLDTALDNTDSYDSDDGGSVSETERLARPAAVRLRL